MDEDNSTKGPQKPTVAKKERYAATRTSFTPQALLENGVIPLNQDNKELISSTHTEASKALLERHASYLGEGLVPPEVPPEVVMHAIIRQTSPPAAAASALQEPSRRSSPDSALSKDLDGIAGEDRNDEEGADDDEEDCSYYPPKVCYSLVTFNQRKDTIPALVLATRCGFESMLNAQ